MALRALAESLLGGAGVIPTEAEFLQAAQSAFNTELGYIGENSVATKRTLGALLSVYWVIADKYDEFTRGQQEERRLTKESWATLQEWTRTTVGLTRSAETVHAMLVFVGISHITKAEELRQANAPGILEPTAALAHILTNTPALVPTFTALESGPQKLIIACIEADFNFGQFLQAENLPVNLVRAKECCGWPDVYSFMGFSLFRMWTALSGILGMGSLEGSLSMTDSMWKNFSGGVTALQCLETESPQRVFQLLLLDRAKAQGLQVDVDVQESVALARLACLSRSHDGPSTEKVSQAFATLSSEERGDLAKFLCADGITQKPGLLLYHVPNFLESAKNNPKFGLATAMRVLLEVCKSATEDLAVTDSDVPFATVMLDELGDHAKTSDADAIFQTCIEWTPVGDASASPAPAPVGKVKVWFVL